MTRTADLPIARLTAVGLKQLPLDKIATFDIELHSRKTRPPAAGFELHIPPVASNHFTVSFPEATLFTEIAGGRGMSIRDARSPSVSSELGAVSAVQVHWGAVPPVPRPAQLTASMLQHLDLRPAYSELNFHLAATIDQGSVDAIEFNLPPNAVVRKSQLRADDLLRSDVIVTKQGQRRLRLVFDKSRTGTVRIDGDSGFVAAGSAGSDASSQIRPCVDGLAGNSF